ncbi:MAG: hypothetical protein N3F64_05295 [Nitrososphaeria archaeon]|nr:hypothetical protein [Nitrososphaeria archaeon]
MSPTYEYIVAVLITILMLGYTYYSVTTLSSNQLQLVEEEQLDVVASRLFDKILLTKGYPEDWGSNLYVNNTSLKDFGLALQHGKMYDLDVDKVMRIYPGVSEIINPLYLNTTTFGTITGLYDAKKGYWKYGFRFLLKTALNITIDKADTKSPTEKFKVTVKNYMGKNAPNAEVKGTYIAIYVVNNEYFDYAYVIINNMTDWMGQAMLDFKNNMPQIPQGISEYAYCLVVSVNYYGLQSQHSYVANTIPTLGLSIQGKYLIANFTQVEDIARGAHHLELTALELTSSLNIIINPALDVTNGEAGKIVNYGGKNYRVYELANSPSQDVIFVGLLVKKQGKWGLVFATRPRTPVAVDYMSMGLKSAGINTVTLSRIVRIGTNSYYAELTLWRMSE